MNRRKLINILIYFLCACGIPYVITGIVNGPRIERSWEEKQDYITMAMAACYKSTDNLEYLKAMAIAIRTYERYKQTGAECDFEPECMRVNEMKRKWGVDYTNNLVRIKDAIKATDGLIIAQNGKAIVPYFHAQSAGRTRECTAWTASVECKADAEARNTPQVTELRRNTLNKLLHTVDSNIALSETLTESFQVVEKDSAGYVNMIQVGNVTMSGETFSKALGLNSTNFELKADKDVVTVTVRGSGMGYGISMNEARARAASGDDYVSIINFFFKNIEITHE